MKYIAPEYKSLILETKEIITSSTDKFEIVHESENEGDVIFSVSNIFS